MRKSACKLLAGLFLGCVTHLALAQTGTVQNHCYLGGQQVLLSGLQSTNYQNGIVPACTVTVYLTGTQTKATIYADGSNTPLSNPFTANVAGSLDPGGWIFWAAANQALDVVLSGGGSNPSCTTAPNCYTQPVTLTGVYPSSQFAATGGNVAKLNGVPYANSQSGSDCGAKINTALSSGSSGLGGGAGVIHVGNGCGSISTPVNVSSPVSVQFDCGTYAVAATVTLSGKGASLVGPDKGQVSGGSTGCVIFQEAAGANLSYMVAQTNNSETAKGITFDGNGANNPSEGPLLIDTGTLDVWKDVDAFGGTGDCMDIGSNGTSPSGQSTTLAHVLLNGCTGRNLHTFNTSDLIITDGSQLENGSSWGADFCNTGGVRIDPDTDISGNASGGVRFDGTAHGSTTINANGCGSSTHASDEQTRQNQIIGAQFSLNGGPDVQVNGFDATNSAFTAIDETISNNHFNGGTGAAHPAIQVLTKSGHLTINGNVFSDQFGSGTYTTFIDNSVSGEQPDTIMGNHGWMQNGVIGNMTAYGPFNLNSTTQFCGQAYYSTNSGVSYTTFIGCNPQAFPDGLTMGGTGTSSSFDSAGNFQGSTVTANIGTAQIFANLLAIPSSGGLACTATSGANCSSSVIHLRSSWWNGTTAQTGDCTLQMVPGTGTNPSQTINIACSNMPGGVTPALDVPGTLSATGTITAGGATGTTVFRCVTAGTLPIGALTINSGQCGTSTDTQLRVQ